MNGKTLYTSLEASKKLLELGFKESFNCMWVDLLDTLEYKLIEVSPGDAKPSIKYIPAYDVDDLGMRVFKQLGKKAVLEIMKIESIGTTENITNWKLEKLEKKIRKDFI